tara:strand:+ start:1606 stop:1878 length:273 start_codon:yes stop_codon:yes gene_type:complete
MSDEITKEKIAYKPTSEEIAQHYTAMGHSVDLINAIAGGTAMKDEAAKEKQDCVDRNVAHLEIMKAKDFWTSEDMSAVDKAITDGKAYKA